MKNAQPFVRQKARKVAFILFEILICKLLREGQKISCDADFFNSPVWPKTPNSTARLSLLNYQAMQMVAAETDIEIDIIEAQQSDIDFHSLLADYDTIVFNQIASPRSHKMLSDFSNFCIENGYNSTNRNIIFGTEVTFFGELKKGTFTQRQIDFVYKECVLLRHTARTDAQVYTDQSCLETRILEFEIGIDTNIVRPELSPESRKFITFVAAPEGRVTKNNDEINAIIQALEREGLDKKYEIKVVKPPYSAVDLWNILNETAFFIFTSNGETFSYVLNDAKSKGAISFYKQHMYCVSIGSRFALDAYPELGIKYYDLEEVVTQIKEIDASPELFHELLTKSREEATARFSVETIAANWQRLFSAERLSNNIAVVFASDISCDKERALEYARSLGGDIAVSVNNAIDLVDGTALAKRDLGSQVSCIRHCFSHDGKHLRYALAKDAANSPYYGANGNGVKDLPQTEVPYWDAFIRLYKVNRIVLVHGEDGPEIPPSLEKVAKVRGIEMDFYLA